MAQNGEILSSIQAAHLTRHQGNVRDWPIRLGLKIGNINPFLGKYRPIVGRCCQSCSPHSWENYFHKSFASMGFCNAACITQERTRFRGWLVRKLCYVIFVLDENFKQDSLQNLHNKIYNSKRVQAVINSEGNPAVKNSSHNGENSSNWLKMEILKILGQVQSTLSPFLIRLVHWSFFRLLNSAFLNVQLNIGQLEMVRQVSQGSSRKPLVFLSTHKSQLDGVLLSLILCSQNLGLPRVAWGDTYTAPTLRAILKRLGVLFLPAEAKGHKKGSSQAFSKAVVASYIDELLADGQNLLLFLEEPFSGAWHLSQHGQQWLEIICAAVISGTLPDVLMLPIGISYDYVPDYYRGMWLLSGLPGLLLTAFVTFGFIGVRFGCVRVDFAQPFSLQEYIANNLFSCRRSQTSLEELLLPMILGTRSGPIDSDRLLEWHASPQSLLKEEEQYLVTKLGLHALSAGVSCSAIMTVSIISALLLHRYREGVFLSRLTNDFSRLIEETLFRNFDVGFSGQRHDLVLHALSLLRHSVFIYCVSLGDVFILPKNSESAVSELSLHSATILPVFAGEAVGACAVNALITEMAVFIDCVDLHAEILLGQEEITEKALWLCHLLPSDILLLMPCLSSYCYCQDVLDKLIHCGLLLAEEVANQAPTCDTGRRRFSEKLLWKAMDDFSDSDSDYDEESGKRRFKINQTGNSPDFFCFLCHLLTPALKTFRRVAEFLCEFHYEGHESECLEKVHHFLLKRAQLDASYECSNRALASSAIQTFKALGVLTESHDCYGLTTLCLSEAFTIQENQTKLLKFIQQFIYKD
ncbi:glycerol-3-phosphate acyltransferase 2, mitochondrial [Ambystoma mexicanum]|uniref:glycerol-3-phosphate acyltransferase 2, mitochondrial n=1 Tax=Ambystoma mexicanum TaxID=8296 RepID=UPI0037E92170